VLAMVTTASKDYNRVPDAARRMTSRVSTSSVRRHRRLPDGARMASAAAWVSGGKYDSESVEQPPTVVPLTHRR
jgi:hypothetical protein